MDTTLLAAVLSPLTGREETRTSSVKSVVILDDNEDSSCDVSDFFAYYRFPNLRHLNLDDCQISSWDLIVGRTSTLTTLSLHFRDLSPTLSQLLSILGSNPFLREVSLSGCALPSGGGDKSPSRASLPRLEEIRLAGDPRSIIRLLNGLDHPANMRHLGITTYPTTLGDVQDTIGPYLRDYLQRRPRFRNGLGLYVDAGAPGQIKFHVGDVHGMDVSERVRMENFVEITIELGRVPGSLRQRAALDLIANARQEEILFLHIFGVPATMADVSANLQHLKALYIQGAPVDKLFPNATSDADGEIFPDLRRITLRYVDAPNGWDPLINFLSNRAFSGNQLDLFEVVYPPIKNPGVEDTIRSMVRQFRDSYREAC
jgi:hypothetical protein